MRYIDSWLTGLGLEYIIPKLKANGITTPKKLALLTLRDMYEVVGVEDAEDRKKLYFLIQRLHTILNNKPEIAGSPGGDNDDEVSAAKSPKSPKLQHNGDISMKTDRNSEEDLRVLRRNRRTSTENNNFGSQGQDSVPYEIKGIRNSNIANKPNNIEDVSLDFQAVALKDSPRSTGGGNRMKKSFAPPLEPPPPSPPREDVPVLSARGMRQDNNSKIRANPSNTGSNVRHHRHTHSTDRQNAVLSPPASPPNVPPPPISSSSYQQRGSERSRNNFESDARIASSAHSVKQSVPVRGGNEYGGNVEDEEIGSGFIEDMAIRVVVRKRPLSKGEISKGDRDVMDISPGGSVMVHEPKTKVDLTKIIETQKFTFDDAFDADETNEVIYSRTIRNLVSFVFDGGKASCFAYGQTGSGKTFSMMGCRPDAPAEATQNAGLYVLAARDIFSHIRKPKFQTVKVLVSCFEIYGGKLYDLLNERGIVKCLEDSKQQVQLPGLTEHLVRNVGELLALMAQAHTQRSTGSTGANAESSRSHQVMQIVLRDGGAKAPVPPVRSHLSARPAPPQPIPPNRFPGGKLSFIDLAGSERGADTTGNSKQTRMEGAEINTSLLALKEVIRSLERKHGHTPFRGSKLTQVLKDSFVGDKTRTCMVACVSPSHTNCEHTLNTLRYADRVKEHQSGGNTSGAHVSSSQYDSMAYDYVPPSKSAPSSQDLPPRPHTASNATNNTSKTAGSNNSSSVSNLNSKPRVPSPAVASSALPSKLQQPTTRRVNTDSVEDVNSSYLQQQHSGRPLSSNVRSVAAPTKTGTKLGGRQQQAESDTVSNGSDARSEKRKSVSYPDFASVQGKAVDSSHTKNLDTRDVRTQKHQMNDRSKLSAVSHNSHIRHRSSNATSDEEESNHFQKERNLLSHQYLAAGYAPPDDEDENEDDNEDEIFEQKQQSRGGYSHQMLTEDEDESDEVAARESYDEDGGLDSTQQLISKTVGLLSAHKQSIAEMVEVMKEEMELVQEMENVDDRDSELYINKLDRILQAKSHAIGELRSELGRFQKYRSKSSKSGRY